MNLLKCFIKSFSSKYCETPINEEPLKPPEEKTKLIYMFGFYMIKYYLF